MHIRTVALAAVVAAIFASIPTHADEQSDWLAQRQAQFAAWQGAHPNVEAQLADLKAKTAVLVAAYNARPRQPRFADLTARSRAASQADRQTALAAFKAGFTLWQSGDFPSAEAAFKQGLDLDPTNGMANFYYGDCLQRRGDKIGAADYMARAVFFGGQSAEAFKAKSALASLPAAPDPDVGSPPAVFRAPGAPTEIWDAPDAPQMVVIPAGEYTMGSPASEQDRSADETQHRVTIGYSFAVGKYDVTRDEFATFVQATGYKAKDDDGCFTYDGKTFNKDSRASWSRPGFGQTGSDPVVCVSWDDAEAYVAWLSQKTGHSYRLLSESEWEYASRAGTTTAYYWGDAVGTGNANCVGCGSRWDNKQTSPSGSFAPNGFGLYDMAGNAWQWLGDCYNDSYAGAPTDGSAWGSGTCGQRVLRGGSWFSYPGSARSANRGRDNTGYRNTVLGFRVARTL